MEPQLLLDFAKKPKVVFIYLHAYLVERKMEFTDDSREIG